MLALATSFDQTPQGDLIETEDGARMIVKEWPQDSETNVVVYAARSKIGVTVSSSQISEDIARLLHLFESKAGGLGKGRMVQALRAIRSAMSHMTSLEKEMRKKRKRVNQSGR